MNLSKKLATLILGMVALASFACQYSYDPVGTYENRREYKRCFYLSGINTPGNHISGITYQSSTWSDDVLGVTTQYDARYIANNYVEVSMPLTVYIGTVDLRGGMYAASDYWTRLVSNSGSEMRNITLKVQYRVMPESSWHTAAVKKFSSGNLVLLTKQKLFGSVQIDCDAAPGSTVLVRLYVAVDHYDQIDKSTGEVSSTQNYLENADPESLTVNSTSDIASVETVTRWSVAQYIEGYGWTNGLTADMNIAPASDIMNIKYLDGWTPQFVMAVTIGNKRRPGK